MGPALTPAEVGREMAACGLLGACLGGARAIFPSKGRGAFGPDLLLVGAVLLLCQSYAAGSGVDGVLRWYLPAAAFGAAFGVQAVLDMPLGRLRQWAVFPLVRCSGALAARRKSRKAARKAAKERRNEKILAKKLQKSLPRERRLLYNSNVSK